LVKDVLGFFEEDLKKKTSRELAAAMLIYSQQANTTSKLYDALREYAVCVIDRFKEISENEVDVSDSSAKNILDTMNRRCESSLRGLFPHLLDGEFDV